MKKNFRFRIGVILLTALICLTGSFAWLLGTTQGTSWLLHTVTRYTDVDIAFDGLEGRLWDRLVLRGLKLEWPHGSLQAKEISFSWHPLMMLTGTFAGEELSADTITIQDNSPEDSTPPDLSWPRVEGIPLRLQAWIDKVTIKDLEYRRPGNTPFMLHHATLLAIWHKGVLQIKNLAFD